MQERRVGRSAASWLNGGSRRDVGADFACSRRGQGGQGGIVRPMRVFSAMVRSGDDPASNGQGSSSTTCQGTKIGQTFVHARMHFPIWYFSDEDAQLDWITTDADCSFRHTFNNRHSTWQVYESIILDASRSRMANTDFHGNVRDIEHPQE